MAQKDILAQEDLEITAVTAGAAPVQLPGKVVSIFPALAHRNYQFYFAGQAISLVGFWLQAVGIGWLVFQLTHSAFWVGAVAAVGGLPFLFLATFAGVFIDRINKQKLLIITQIFEAIFATILGFLVISNQINLTLVILLAFASGVVGSFDLPARFAFIVEMIGKRDLASAVSLNAGIFNAARFIGPTIAGVIIASFGVGWAFILNGASYLPGIWAVAVILPVLNRKPEVNIHPLQSLKDGWIFILNDQKILNLTILAAIGTILIAPYQTLMPAIAQKVFSSGAQGLGSLLSSAGAGSLLGAILTSALSHKKNKTSFIIWGLAISSVSLILFSLNKNFLMAHILLFFTGFGTIMLASTLNTLVQLLTPDQMRGRIMAVYLTMFVGMMPIGNALAGVVAQKTSPLFAVGLGATVVLIFGIYFYIRGVFANLS